MVVGALSVLQLRHVESAWRTYDACLSSECAADLERRRHQTQEVTRMRLLQDAQTQVRTGPPAGKLVKE
jgi:hypothetical protein